MGSPEGREGGVFQEPKRPGTPEWRKSGKGGSGRENLLVVGSRQQALGKEKTPSNLHVYRVSLAVMGRMEVGRSRNHSGRWLGCRNHLGEDW